MLQYVLQGFITLKLYFGGAGVVQQVLNIFFLNFNALTTHCTAVISPPHLEHQHGEPVAAEPKPSLGNTRIF